MDCTEFENLFPDDAQCDLPKANQYLWLEIVPVKNGVILYADAQPVIGKLVYRKKGDKHYASYKIATGITKSYKLTGWQNVQEAIVKSWSYIEELNRGILK